MAEFASKTFRYTHYAANRPTYSKSLYSYISGYHGRRPIGLAVDLGCGHGVVARALVENINAERVIACDVSEGMLDQARRLSAEYPQISYHQASAESLAMINDGSVDLVVAATAAHWFNVSEWLKEMKRIMCRGGTLAIWGYSNLAFRGDGMGRVNAIIEEECSGLGSGLLKDCWAEGTRKLTGGYENVRFPEEDWEHELRFRHKAAEAYQTDEPFIVDPQQESLRQVMSKVRTWSAYHKWMTAHPQARARDEGGSGDVADLIFDQIRIAGPDWMGNDDCLEQQVHVDWGTTLVMARKK